VEDEYDTTPVRQEQVDAVAVNGDLKPYSVVCGSFSLQANAQALKEYLVDEGYNAGIVKNVDKNMFRVIIGSYDTKAEAARAREAFKVKYPSRADFQGAWILLNK
jgi:cell division protein FtsN